MTEAVRQGTVAPVAGYQVALDRAYDAKGHLWVLRLPNGRVRLGMDPLGVETTGTVAHVALEEVGAELAVGDALGTVEAEKFVGPLTTPLSGTVAARNDAVVGDPEVLYRDPFGAGWLVELAPSDLDAEWCDLVTGAERVVAWFADEVERYRRDGVLAE